jgi:hypothetical protein
MEKPSSMSIKEWLIKTVALELKMNEKIVSNVISDSFERANAATLIHKSIEISGFGKFFYNDAKALKVLEKAILKKADFEKQLENPDMSETDRRQKGIYLHAVIMDIKKIKARL